MLECELGVALCELLEASLLAALGGPQLDARAAARREQLLERGEVSGLGWHDDQRRDAGRGPVVLHAERLDERLQVLAGGVLERQAVAVDHAPVAQREHLDGRHVAADGEADHVDRADVPAVRGLTLGEMADRVEPVPLPGRLFELLLRGGLAHAALELLLDGTRLAGQELDDAVDDLGRTRQARRRRCRARGSGRCGSRGTGCPHAAPVSAPRRAGSGTTRLSTSSVSRTFLADE